jgi:hypothetical protein
MKGFLRPDFVVMPENSIVPAENLIKPPPNQFTHELTHRQPFYYAGPQQGRPPDGEFPEGTRVVLLVHDAGGYCRVADGRGLYVAVECDALKRI